MIEITLSSEIQLEFNLFSATPTPNATKKPKTFTPTAGDKMPESFKLIFVILFFR